jgi:hypothetical protein
MIGLLVDLSPVNQFFLTLPRIKHFHLKIITMRKRRTRSHIIEDLGFNHVER